MIFSIFFLAAAADPSAVPTPARDKTVKLVCKREDSSTGSRLRGKKICKTKEEWQAIDEQQKKDRSRTDVRVNG